MLFRGRAKPRPERNNGEVNEEDERRENEPPRPRENESSRQSSPGKWPPCRPNGIKSSSQQPHGTHLKRHRDQAGPQASDRSYPGNLLTANRRRGPAGQT